MNDGHTSNPNKNIYFQHNSGITRGILPTIQYTKDTKLAKKRYTQTYNNLYCVFIGNQFYAYEQESAQDRTPLFELRIVGSSAWHGKQGITADKFRMLTYANSQLVCFSPCTAQWLAALHTGLEAHYASDHTTTTSTSLSSHDHHHPNASKSPTPADSYDTHESNHSLCESCRNGNIAKLYACPLPQYHLEQAMVCADCYLAQGVYRTMLQYEGMMRGYTHECQALQLARSMVEALRDVSRKEDDVIHTNAPKASSNGTPTNDDAEEEEDWEHISHTNDVINDVSTSYRSKLLLLLQTPEFHTLRRRSALLENECKRLQNDTVTSHDFLQYLDDDVTMLHAQYLRESLNMRSSSNSNSNNNNSTNTNHRCKNGEEDVTFGHVLELLKTYVWNPTREGALRQVQILLEYVLDHQYCHSSANSTTGSTNTSGSHKALEFYLPQLYMIHNALLPARTAQGVFMLLMYEEFLLVLCQRSVHIAMEVTWHTLALLQKNHSTSAAAVSVDRMSATEYSLLKFVCQVESQVFGFYGDLNIDNHHPDQTSRKKNVCYWGGGAVVLQDVKVAKWRCTNVQQEGMYHTMRVLKECNPFPLKYHDDVDVNASNPINRDKDRMAVYYRDQITFQRSLSNLADALFTIPHADQASYLQQQLQVFNEKQMFGLGFRNGNGSSSNSDAISKVVRIPSREGHVFRSKARTPVLLLLEVLNTSIHNNVDVSTDNTSNNDDVTNSTANVITQPSTEFYSVLSDGRRLVLTTLLDSAKDHALARQSTRSAYGFIQTLDRNRAQELLSDDVGNSINNNDVSNIVSNSDTGGDLEEDEVMEALRLLLLTGVHAHGPQPNSYHTSSALEDSWMITSNSDANIDTDQCDSMITSDSPIPSDPTPSADVNNNNVGEVDDDGFTSSSTNSNNSDSSVPESNNDVKKSQSKSSTKCNEMPELNNKDAGYHDARLAGCGPLSAGIQTALQLYKSKTITKRELLQLAKSDLKYISTHLRQQQELEEQKQSLAAEDCAFWSRFAFGERWAEKKARIASTSPYGNVPGWDLQSVIVKANDDVRQEAFVMQLIELCKVVWDAAGLELWVKPYKIVPTGKSTGVIETIQNAMSLDALKKRKDYNSQNMSLLQHFERMTEYAADPMSALATCKTNFVRSLAAYSLICHLFQVKDRHNGNILLDTAGHIIHIDFGFVFGIAPGGSFSLEAGTPFKLTEEMIDVMGGVGSPLFTEFVTLFCCGFLALQRHAGTFLTLIEITYKSMGATMPCFAPLVGTQNGCKQVLDTTRQLFRTDLVSPSEYINSSGRSTDNSANASGESSRHLATVCHALDLIKTSMSSYGTSQYDYFQYMSQGIAA